MTAFLLALGIIAVVLVLVVLSRSNGPDLPPPECSEVQIWRLHARA